MYRSILILFVAYDILFCLFYIIDYNDYAAKTFYLINGLIMILDCVARIIFVKKRVHWFRDVLFGSSFD